MEHLFDLLDLSTRTRLVWKNGKLIADRTDAAHRITLYKLYSFYVEVVCDPGFTTIEDVLVVNSPEQLERYELQDQRSPVFENGRFVGAEN